jgi:DNA repair protein RadC
MARAILADDPREGLLAFYLDNRHRVMAVHRVSVGTCEATVVAPREVFCPAVALSAQCIVVAHNHPSGDATPSGEDRMVTERLKRAGDILGIEVLDHLVLGAERYFTFAEETFRAYPVTA